VIKIIDLILVVDNDKDLIGAVSRLRRLAGLSEAEPAAEILSLAKDLSALEAAPNQFSALTT
jgi:hypothetical protein